MAWAAISASPCTERQPSPPSTAGLSHLSHEVEEVGVVPAGTHHLASHGVLFAVGAESIDAEAAQQSEVFGPVILAGAALVLAEDHVEAPMQAVLDVPVPAHDGKKVLGRHRPREHVEAAILLALAIDEARAADLADRTEPRKGVLAAEPGRAHDAR